MQLKPLPQAPCTRVAGFSSTKAAGDAVARVVREGLVPSLLEIMDATSIKAVEAYLRTDLGAGSQCQALLLAQSDAGAEMARRELAAIEQICLNCGADLAYSTDDLAEGSMLLQARRVVLNALELYGVWLTDDVCVPRTRIAELIVGCQRISEEVGLRIAVVGHAGDGNMHPTIVYSPDSPKEFKRAKQPLTKFWRSGFPWGARSPRTWCRQDQTRVAGARDRSGRLACPPPDQGRSRPREPLQPRLHVLPRRKPGDLGA